MKIKIEHIPNTYNYGSLMMAINIIKNLNDRLKSKNVEFYVDCETEKDLLRLKNETLLDNIYIHKKRALVDSNKVLRFIDYKKRLAEESKEFDGVIVIGGDDISEYYGQKLLIKELVRLNFMSKKMKVFLVGQTIGPFNYNHTKFLAKKVLNETFLYTRDYDCLQYLNKLGVKNIFDSRDLAFLDLPLQNNTEVKKNILNKYNLENEKYITIVPSGLTGLYTKNFDDYMKGQIDITKSILDNPRLSDFKIVLLSHVLKPECVNDATIVGKIIESMDKKYLSRIIPISQEMLASEARIILGNGLFSITGRMHAAVSSFQMKKPSLALSYSVKYKGVIGTGLDMNDLIIEANDELIWKNQNIVKKVNEKVNYILDNYDIIINKINKKMSNVEEMVTSQIDDICTRL